MKHSILILTDPFEKPSFSPRLRAICNHFTTLGWDIDVYTEKWAELEFDHDYAIHEFIFIKNKNLDWFVKAILSLLFNWKDKNFYQLVSKNIENKQYDIVFCTTFSTFPLYTAQKIAKKRNLPLFVDLRDIDEQCPNSQAQLHRQWWTIFVRKWYRNTNIRRRNKAIKDAQIITTVSPWHVNFLKQFNNNVKLIYNGFDKNKFYPQDISTETFKLTYTGRIYEPILQDPTLLFVALKNLKNKIDFKLCFYSNRHGLQRMESLAKQYGIEDKLLLQPYVELNKIKHILHESSILLVFSNKSTDKGPHGMMTTKFYEALGVEKPIICVRSDEECLANVIRETNAGLAATSAQEIEQFILEKYKEWQENGFTHQQVRNKELYTRQQQVKQFEQIIDDICNHTNI